MKNAMGWFLVLLLGAGLIFGWFFLQQDLQALRQAGTDHATSDQSMTQASLSGTDMRIASLRAQVEAKTTLLARLDPETLRVQADAAKARANTLHGRLIMLQQQVPQAPAMWQALRDQTPPAAAP